MTQTKTLVDVEGPVKAWARSLSLTGVGSRVFLAVPERASFPIIAFRRVGGQPQLGETPLDDALISFDVWGGSSEQAAIAAYELASAAESIVAGTLLDATVRCMGAQVSTGPYFFNDQVSNKPRYVIDITFTVKAV